MHSVVCIGDMPPASAPLIQCQLPCRETIRCITQRHVDLLWTSSSATSSGCCCWLGRCCSSGHLRRYCCCWARQLGVNFGITTVHVPLHMAICPQAPLTALYRSGLLTSSRCCGLSQGKEIFQAGGPIKIHSSRSARSAAPDSGCQWSEVSTEAVACANVTVSSLCNCRQKLEWSSRHLVWCAGCTV